LNIVVAFDVEITISLSISFRSY